MGQSNKKVVLYDPDEDWRTDGYRTLLEACEELGATKHHVYKAMRAAGMRQDGFVRNRGRRKKLYKLDRLRKAFKSYLEKRVEDTSAPAGYLTSQDINEEYGWLDEFGTQPTFICRMFGLPPAGSVVSDNRGAGAKYYKKEGIELVDHGLRELTDKVAKARKDYV